MSDRDSPWGRLSTSFCSLFEPVDPRAPPPDASPAVKEWMFNVSAVTAVCMAFSGWQESVRLSQQVITPPKHLPPALHDMYVRNQASGRLAKVGTRALAAGWHALLFGGLFYGLDSIIATARDKHGRENTAGGGAATGALYGALLPGSVPFKCSRACLGAAVGGAAGMAVGWLQHDLAPMLEERSQKASDTKSADQSSRDRC